MTNKDVFAKRKEGALDEAYQMALELMAAAVVDEWDKKAFAWCLVDLIKREAQSGNAEYLAHYRRQLESIEFATADEVLTKGIRAAISLCNPYGRKISEAKSLSKNGRHAEATTLYREVWVKGAADQEIKTSLGWELYRYSKALIAAEHFNLDMVRRNLSDFLKLNLERPSLLHSCILQLAAKLAGQDKLNMLAFSRLWDLRCLRSEDYEAYRTDDGKQYPSLAEKVIGLACKGALASEQTEDKAYVLPFVDAAIERFPENVFLKLNKAKVLVALGRHDEALAFAVQVAKAKSNDYWAWELLGDIVAQQDAQAAQGCYCKALTCPADDKFTGKIRLKVALYMLEHSDFTAAKHEIETITQAKEREGYKVPEAVAELASQPWFEQNPTTTSNRNYYREHASSGEAVLFKDVPWIDGCVGETFVVPGKDGKKEKTKRKVYLKTGAIATEVSISEAKLGHLPLAAGDAVKVKGEFDQDQRFNFFVLERRAAETPWDVFCEHIGVVNHVNPEKGVIRYLVEREVSGTLSVSALSSSFVEGDAIALELSKSFSKRGLTYRVREARATDKQPSESLRKSFTEEVRISNGMGFTKNDIFIPPHLVAQSKLEDDQMLSGIAVLAYNPKRSSWGWRAVVLN